MPAAEDQAAAGAEADPEPPPPPPLIDPALVAAAVAAWERQGRPVMVTRRNEWGQPFSTTSDLAAFLLHPGRCCLDDWEAAIEALLRAGT